ncbi:hypothetical protein Mettu_0092 [Methylobacter tundripaludum SV96]|uniref:Uncharacterized protein n=1 Tax=Methylobacter tundripaludum (strain ATCC BAA-1195 / DSM 17260 / SV96) TaxID=697282 RepID=G3IT50_METTV|nr:hypothetical protein Mettu_0092 [Methylobacter tundripaludum SV96]
MLGRNMALKTFRDYRCSNFRIKGFKINDKESCSFTDRPMFRLRYRAMGVYSYVSYTEGWIR